MSRQLSSTPVTSVTPAATFSSSGEQFLSATCSLITADPSVSSERPFIQPLYRHVPPENSCQTDFDLSRIERNTVSAIESDGPQPVLGGYCVAHTAAETQNPRAPCTFDRSGRPLTSVMIDRFGDSAPRLSTIKHTSTDHKTMSAPMSRECPTTQDCLQLPRGEFAEHTGKKAAVSCRAREDRAACLKRVREARALYAVPCARSGHIMVALRSRQSVITHGGLGEVSLNDTWEYHVQTQTWRQLDCKAVDFKDFITDGAHDSARSADLTPAGAPSPTNRSTASDETYLRSPRAAPRLPLCAFGQAATAFHSPQLAGEEIIAMYGGIDDDSQLDSTLYLFRPSTASWTRVGTTPPLPSCWGCTMETLQVAKRDARGNIVGEEEVGVLFGGMTNGNSCPAVTRIIHWDHTLTMEELKADPARYLGEELYKKKKEAFLRDALDQSESFMRRSAPQSWHNDDTTLDAFLAEPMTPRPHGHEVLDWRQPNLALAHASADAYALHMTSVRDVVRECQRVVANVGALVDLDAKTATAATAPHNDVEPTGENNMDAWLEKELQPYVDTYWVETIDNPPGLVGRRRAAGAVYKKKFLFVFGGRDETVFFNDFWVFNVETRTWAPIRAEMPLRWLQEFFAHPDDPLPGAQLQAMYKTLSCRVGREIADRNMNPFLAIRHEQKALYQSSENSTAGARTGAVMVFDAHRECIYVYGGFTLSEGKYLTYFDLHVYSIHEHVWRRVNVVRGRQWEAHMDGMEDVVLPISATDEVRTYPRWTQSPQARADDMKAFLTLNAASTRPHGAEPPRSMGIWRWDGSLSTSLTALNYTQRHLFAKSPSRLWAKPAAETSSLVTTKRGLVLVRQGSGAPTTVAAPAPWYLPLPVLVPEPRTMAAMVPDPTSAGRFFLFGGRSDDTALGDMFVITVSPCTRADEAFRQIQTKLATKPPCVHLKYEELAEVQRRMRSSVSDGLLRGTSFTQTAQAQNDGTLMTDSGNTSVFSVYGQALLWLRGLTDTATRLPQLTPDLQLSEDGAESTPPPSSSLPRAVSLVRAVSAPPPEDSERRERPSMSSRYASALSKAACRLRDCPPMCTAPPPPDTDTLRRKAVESDSQRRASEKMLPIVYERAAEDWRDNETVTHLLSATFISQSRRCRTTNDTTASKSCFDDARAVDTAHAPFADPIDAQPRGSEMSTPVPVHRLYNAVCSARPFGLPNSLYRSPAPA